MKYKGSCHCGKVAYEVEGEIKGAMSCNCSICQRKGSLLWFVPKTAFKLLTPESNASTYTFNRHIIKHRFCPVCGTAPYSEAINPKSGEPTAAINLRCVEGIDLKSIPVKEFDGRSL
jgi:hypothetical protein